MIGDSKKKPVSVLAIALQIATWSAGLQQNGFVRSELPKDITVSERAARVRESVAGGIREIDAPSKNVQLVQWVNWGNWSNWPNWNNWNNWASWVNM